MRFRKVIKLGVVSVTLKALLWGCLVVGTFTNTAKAEKQCWGIKLYGTCFCAKPDNTRVGQRIRKAPVGSTLAAPTCIHGAAWGCAKCGHLPPKERFAKENRPAPFSLRDPRSREQPVHRSDRSHQYDDKVNPDRPDVTGIPWCPACRTFHRPPKVPSAIRFDDRSDAKGESSTRRNPIGNPVYRRGAASGSGALNGKVTVCDRCGGSCTTCRCDGNYPPPQIYRDRGKSSPKIAEGIISPDVGNHLIIEASGIAPGPSRSVTRQVLPLQRIPVNRPSTSPPQTRDTRVERKPTVPSRGATVREQLKGVNGLNHFRR